MATQTPLDATVTSTESTISVTTDMSGAGLAIPATASNSIQLANIDAGQNPLQYKVDAGAWVVLDAGQGVTLPLDLSASVVRVRKGNTTAGAVKLRLIVSTVDSIQAGGVALRGFPGIGAGVSAFPASRVTNPTGLDRWYYALGRAERSPARMLGTGNSVFDGVSTDGSTVPTDADMDLNGSFGVLRAKYAREYGAPMAGAIPAGDTRWTTTGTAPQTIGSSVAGPGGGRGSVMSSGATKAVTTPVCTNIDLFYYAGTGLGAFTYSIDGGGAVTVDTTQGAAGYRKISLTGLASQTHTINIVATANLTYFLAAEYHSGRGVIVGKYARSSWGLKDTYGTGVLSSGASAGAQQRAKQGFAMGSPDLVTIGYVRNDWKGNGTTGYTPAQYVADLEEIYGYVIAAGGCILVTAEPDDQHATDATGASYGPSSLASFHAAAKTWAQSKQHAAFMSIADMWGTWAQGQANGLYRAGSDEIHPGIVGQADVGRMLYSATATYRAYV